MAASGAAHGSVVASEAQERGRGRLGRAWHSPPGPGLYVSVVLRPAGIAGPAGAEVRSGPASITLTAGVALAEALQAATGLRASIKWPNDLVAGSRKVCGVLAEASTLAGELRHVVLGYGINVRAAAYPSELAGRATSIEAELGRTVDPADVFGESLACLAERLRQLADGGIDAILDAWRAWSPTSVGARVEVASAGGPLEGVTAGIDLDGALLVRIGGGIHRVVAGEVRWLTDGARL
jgi:BirA family biotin operon repressor/biotin-[acetyl-CoA-carboxylase] ligase